MLSAALAEKIDEQIERTIHLIGLVPANQLEWKPPIPGAWAVNHVLGHMLDCLAGFCAVLYAAYPERLQHFDALRHLPVNHACDPVAACERIGLYRLHIKEGFGLLADADLGRKLPTVFVAEGETVLALLLGNLEHLINHKHQLFMYLRLLAVPVGTPNLYRFRGSYTSTT